MKRITEYWLLVDESYVSRVSRETIRFLVKNRLLDRHVTKSYHKGVWVHKCRTNNRGSSVLSGEFCDHSAEMTET